MIRGDEGQVIWMRVLNETGVRPGPAGNPEAPWKKLKSGQRMP